MAISKNLPPGGSPQPLTGKPNPASVPEDVQEESPPNDPQDSDDSGRGSKLTGKYLQGAAATGGLTGVSDTDGRSQADIDEQAKEVLTMLEYGPIYQRDPAFADIIERLKHKLEEGSLTAEDLEGFQKELGAYRDAHISESLPRLDLAVNILGPDPEGAKGAYILDRIEHIAKTSGISPKLQAELKEFIEKYRKMIAEGTFNREEFMEEYKKFFSNPQLPAILRDPTGTIAKVWVGPFRPWPEWKPIPEAITPSSSPLDPKAATTKAIEMLKWYAESFSKFDNGQLLAILQKYEQKLQDGSLDENAVNDFFNELGDYKIKNNYTMSGLFSGGFNKNLFDALRLLRPDRLPPFPDPQMSSGHGPNPAQHPEEKSNRFNF